MKNGSITNANQIKKELEELIELSRLVSSHLSELSESLKDREVTHGK
ncbi:MAG TPA: hypothetical protein VEA92_01485 [Candidatus Paceibacterota bacterium]|nr:hypothetical protein [Candidatus Paceibacterota bacterium]